MYRVEAVFWVIALPLVATAVGYWAAQALWTSAIILRKRLKIRIRHPKDRLRITSGSHSYWMGLPKGVSNGDASECAEVPAGEGQRGQRQATYQEATGKAWNPGLHRPRNPGRK